MLRLKKFEVTRDNIKKKFKKNNYNENLQSFDDIKNYPDNRIPITTDELMNNISDMNEEDE